MPTNKTKLHKFLVGSLDTLCRITRVSTSTFSKNLSVCCEEWGVLLNDFLSYSGITKTVFFSKPFSSFCYANTYTAKYVWDALTVAAVCLGLVVVALYIGMCIRDHDCLFTVLLFIFSV